MATIIPITAHPRGRIGATPFRPIPVDRRPTSFADALEQYRSAKRAEEAAYHVDDDAGSVATEHVADCCHRLLAQPLATVHELAEALTIAQAESPYGSIEKDNADLIIEQVVRLAARR